MKRRLCAIVLAGILGILTPMEGMAAVGSNTETNVQQADNAIESEQPVATPTEGESEVSSDSEVVSEITPTETPVPTVTPESVETEIPDPVVDPAQVQETVLEAPVLENYKAGSETVTGTSIAEYQIHVEIGSEVYTGITDKENKFTVTVPKLGENVELSVYAEHDGNKSEICKVNTGYIPGWTSDGRYRTEDGTYLKSQWIDKIYVDQNGYKLKAGWRYIEHHWYYMKSTGEREESKWLKLNKKWYWIAGDGIMATGLTDVKGELYYFASDGVMKTGWIKTGSPAYWYYFTTKGSAYKGWIKQKGIWYYLRTDGTMATGWVRYCGKWYYMNGSGAMKTGWIKDEQLWYYLNSDGIMQRGWIKLSGKWYYLQKDGSMQTGWLQLAEDWYYMNGSGAMKTGWVYTGGNWFYLNSKGIMQTGWTKLGTKWYYLNAGGSMQIGWKKLSEKWYYMNSSGVMQIGWIKLGSKWYYLRNNGQSADPDSLLLINGKYYSFDSDCSWVGTWTTASRRAAMVKVAEESIGKIPYYWGGFASYPGYEGNNFGSITTVLDHIGRNKKGMDCSHWVDWVCWTAFGDNLGNGYTGVIADQSTKISESELIPGDLAFMGSYPYTHVGLYVGDGYFVHCNATANNVSKDNVQHWTSFYRLNILK